MYNVGTKIISKVDASRVETLGPSTGSRQCTARIYYPTSDVGGKKADLGKNAVGEMFVDASHVKDEKFPVIVYNHGYGAVMESNNHLCCELAANGYIVVAVGHAYEAESVTLESGSTIKLDKNVTKKVMGPVLPAAFSSLRLKSASGTYVEQYKQFLEFQNKYGSFLVDRLEQWAKDVLVIMAEVKERLADVIDLDFGIGITGHSFGGCLAYYMCQNYREYSCGVNIDGALFGHYDDFIMSKPFFQICSKGNESVVSRSLIITEAPVYFAVFNKLSHIGFTDMKFAKKTAPGYGSMPADVMSTNLNRIHTQFFNLYLKREKVEIDIVNNDYVKTSIVNKSKSF